MAKFLTKWHRFKQEETGSPTQGEGYSVNNLIDTGEGEAELPNVSDIIILSSPSVIDSSGTELTFLNELPTDAVVTGVQYQYYLEADNSNNSIFIHYPRLNTNDGTDNQMTGVDLFGGTLVTYPTNISDNLLGLNVTRINADDLQFKILFNLELGVGNRLVVSGFDFENANGPSPAVRLEYEIPPKFTLTTGKLSITSGKMNIV